MAAERDDAEREAATSGLVGRSIDEFVNQLRGFTDRARVGRGRGAVEAVPARRCPARPARCRPPS